MCFSAASALAVSALVVSALVDVVLYSSISSKKQHRIRKGGVHRAYRMYTSIPTHTYMYIPTHTVHVHTIRRAARSRPRRAACESLLTKANPIHHYTPNEPTPTYPQISKLINPSPESLDGRSANYFPVAGGEFGEGRDDQLGRIDPAYWTVLCTVHTVLYTVYSTHTYEVHTYMVPAQAGLLAADAINDFRVPCPPSMQHPGRSNFLLLHCSFFGFFFFFFAPVFPFPSKRYLPYCTQYCCREMRRVIVDGPTVFLPTWEDGWMLSILLPDQ